MQNPVYNFSAYDHAIMLSDQIRLDAYYSAILHQVKPGMVVAEIGTGTGILSAFAASVTSAPVYGIEFYEQSAQMATEMMAAAEFKNVQILRGKSFDLTLSPSPDILVTETIGALGPEENIVEICNDFKKRHPSIQKIIPSRLKVMAEPVRSKKIRDYEFEFYDYYSLASFGKFDYKAIRPTLEKIWTNAIRYDVIADCETIAPPTVLADYILGETEAPDFEKKISVMEFSDMDAIHLYFEATLDEETLLSTHYSKPETHWRQAYVKKPKAAKSLTVSYQASSQNIFAVWDT